MRSLQSSKRIAVFTAIFALLSCHGLPIAAQVDHPQAAYIPFADARPVIEQFHDELPLELKHTVAAALSAKWPDWVRSRDREVRARLQQGEEDSLANLLLYGISYTAQPRVTADYVRELESQGNPSAANTLTSVVNRRAEDLVHALANPKSDERMSVMRALVDKKGYSPATASGRESLTHYLVMNLDRVRAESARYAAAMQAAVNEKDDAKAFALRSEVFQTRGLSLDSNWRPNYGLEATLKEAAAQGFVRSVRRVAIVGPGLDFIDKSAGYDVYPPQTIQPFAVIDSLLRLGLANPKTLEITTLDISSRVNEHLRRARSRALKGGGYVVQLPREASVPWMPDAAEYWAHFGDRIGVTIAPQAVPASAGNLRLRAVRIRPEFVQRVAPADLNIVLQRLALSPTEKFDLIIGTNVFVYYGQFEQGLARLNVADMLKPGGLLITNDALPEVAHSALKEVHRTAVRYSERRQDGDWFQIYQCMPRE